MFFDWKKDGQEVFLYDEGKHYNQGRTGQDEQFKGRVFHFEEELKHGNASIKVHKTKMADNGSYTCNFPKTNPKFEYHITLVVGEYVYRTVWKTEATVKVLILIHLKCL